MTQAKSSITLPPAEFRLVKRLRGKLKAKSNVDVVRRSLQLLEAQFDRENLRQAFRNASLRVRQTNATELTELDRLADEGLDA